MKKGQITVFIIIGIIIAVSMATVMYIRGRAAREIPIEEFIEVPEVAAELAPVDSFVKSCIRNLAEEGLKTAEEHGGYVNQDTLFAGFLSSTEGNAVEFVPGSGIKIPYWSHMKSADTCTSNCVFETTIPPLCKQGRDCITQGEGSTEEQLEDYINDNIRGCLNEFEEIEKVGFDVTELDEPRATVIIRDKDVLIKLKYPLRIAKGESTGEISDFVLTVRSDIKEMYIGAYEITNYEIQNCFIGKHTQNYLSFFMGLGAGKLPPTYGSTMGDSSIRIWMIKDVKELLKAKLVTAVQVIGVFYTQGFVWPTYEDTDDPYYTTRQGILDQRVFKPFDEFKEFSVSFTYLPWWEPYLEIKPDQGGVLMPTSLGMDEGITAILGTITQLKEYEFFYQYSFPTVVDIRKVDYQGREHVFRFALETNVRSNRCFGPDITLSYRSNPYASGLCDAIQATKQAKITTRELIYEYGRFSEKPLDGVRVDFFAGATCALGATDENGVIEAKYPLAYGGVFRFNKLGYGETIVNAHEVTDGTVVLLDKIKELDASVKHYKMKRDKSLPSSSAELGIGETVIIMLEKIDAPKLPPQALSFKDKSTSDIPLKLIPGTYEVTANYFYNESFMTPKHCAHICEDIIKVYTDDSWDFETKTPISKCCGKSCPPEDGICKCPTDPLGIIECCTDISEWIPKDEQAIQLIGGAKFNEEIEYWEVKRDDLRITRKVEFKVVSIPDPDCIMTENCVVPGCVGYADEMGNLDSYYAQFKRDLKPKLLW